jgi:Coenzyme PQQ synthesis protein D (PqqD)
VLNAVLGSWRVRASDSIFSPSGERPIISVHGKGNGYSITSPWLSDPVVERSAVGAIFSLVAELARAFAEEHSPRVCFHCAAVARHGRLIVFPNTENAGKSTLAARLAAAGLRIYADDVLPISSSGSEGMALGLAPRLRRPLPADAGAELCSFVEAHRGPADDEFLYLSLPPDLLADYGETAPIGAVVLLDRQASAPARLAPIERGAALRHLVVQNFAPGGTTLPCLDRLLTLIRSIPCFTLRYSDLDAAAIMLVDHFAGPNALQNARIERRETGMGVVLPAAKARPQVPSFQQSLGVVVRAIEDDAFLVKPGEQAVFHLNALGASLWFLLEQPTTMETTTGLLKHLFPQVKGSRIKRDVRALFAGLQAAGLIHIVTPWVQVRALWTRILVRGPVGRLIWRF